MKNLLLITTIAVLLCAGCGWNPGKQSEKQEVKTEKKEKSSHAENRDELIEVSPMASIDRATEIDEEGPELSAPSSTEITSSTGINVKTTNSQIKIHSKSKEAKNSNVSESAESFSDVDFFEPKNGTLLLLAGILVVAGIVVAVWFGKVVLGIAISMAGGCLFGFIFYPWMGIMCVLVSSGVGVYYVLQHRDLVNAETINKDREDVLYTVIRAVEEASTTASEEIKSLVTKLSGKDANKVKDEISRIKKDL